MQNISTLVLFDIDKTLIKSSKGHREAFSNAFREVYGVNTTIDIITPDEMTDQQIIIDVLKKKAEVKKITDQIIKIAEDRRTPRKPPSNTSD